MPDVPLGGTLRQEPGSHRMRTPACGALVLLLLPVGLSGCNLPRWPVEGRPTSGFGLRTLGGWPDIHRGVDFPLAEGTPVRAMAGGHVRFAGTMSGFGNVVWLDHGRAVLSVYAHLSRIDVRAGAAVDRGDVLGASGSTGQVTAPHLHFEVWRFGRPVDPVPMLGGLAGR